MPTSVQLLLNNNLSRYSNHMKLNCLGITLFALMMALPGFAKDKRGKQAMKIISYNIEYGMRADTTGRKDHILYMDAQPGSRHRMSAGGQ